MAVECLGFVPLTKRFCFGLVVQQASKEGFLHCHSGAQEGSQSSGC
jgi:hypothetical protein